MPAVIDASVAAKWLLGDERSKSADAVLEKVSREGARIPAIFTYEIENILVVAERRRRIGEAEIVEALGLLKTLDLRIDSYEPSALGRHTQVSRRHALSAYDAAYIVLASQLRVAFYTADNRLAAAARKEKIATVLVT